MILASTTIGITNGATSGIVGKTTEAFAMIGKEQTMRLIDADELKKHKYHGKKACENAVAVYHIDNAPTVDIVRCGECKAYDSEYEWCGGLGLEMKPDDFCSYGERNADSNTFNTLDALERSSE